MTSRHALTTLAALGFWASLQGASVAAPITYTFTPQSTVTYHVTHPLHHIDGVSHRVLGAIKVEPGHDVPDLVLPLRFAVPVTTFGSGNRNRDRNMLVTVNAGRYPEALVQLDSVAWKSRQQQGAKVTAEGIAKGTLTMHGVTKPITIPLTGSISGNRLEVSSAFSFLCTDYGIDRPALFFKPIDDEVKIEVAGVALR